MDGNTGREFSYWGGAATHGIEANRPSVWVR
jgi:hypothetical protein